MEIFTRDYFPEFLRSLHILAGITWIGLLVILYVALKMIWEGFHEVAPYALAMT